MRSRTKFTLHAEDVKSVAADWIQKHLQLDDYSRRCTWQIMISVLLFAAARARSIFDACQRLRDAPSDETLRQALRATLPLPKDLEARLNAALGDGLPKAFYRRGQRLAIDVTPIPYHGEPWKEYREICRSKPKSGTTHFHAYATAYVAQHGQRFTVALTWVFSDETMDVVVKRLMRQVQQLGVKVRLVLLDKGFFNVEVVRYLQAARYPFLMPAFARGRKPKQPKPDSLHAYAARKRSGWARYRWRNEKQRQATVQMAIVCLNYRGQRGRKGRRTQLYAYWGFRPGSARWVYETYRLRFGIETSYRQMNQLRIRTSTRDPLLRLLFVGLALILRNVWVWCHLTWLAERRGASIRLRAEILRVTKMTLWLQHVVIAELHIELETTIAKPRQPRQLAT